ncbi:MAG TPA: hypothetical protein PLP07_11865 [Pyrinomonadaceae bacterium]|nr:hypothetical protein [Pyrinomonadaceae bacterium]
MNDTMQRKRTSGYIIENVFADALTFVEIRHLRQNTGEEETLTP